MKCFLLKAKVVPRGKLIMKMPSFHKPEIVPPVSAEDREKKATYLCDAIKRFESLIPRGAPVQSVMLVPEISTVFMQIVNNLRVCDLETLEKLWQKCKETQSRYVKFPCIFLRTHCILSLASAASEIVFGIPCRI